MSADGDCIRAADQVAEETVVELQARICLRADHDFDEWAMQPERVREILADALAKMDDLIRSRDRWLWGR